MPRQRIYRLIGTLVLALVAVLVIAKGWRIYTLATDLRGTLDPLSKLSRTAPQDINLQQSAQTLSRARADLSDLHSELSPILWLTDSLGWVPGLGDQLASVRPGLTYAEQLTVAGDELMKAALPLMDVIQNGSGEHPLELAVGAVQANRAHFELAGQALQAAADARKAIQAEALPASISDRLATADALLPTLQAAVAGAQLIPDMLGASNSASYLILAQNQDELRATGGFITGVGTVQFSRGSVADFSIQDSYKVDDLTKDYPWPPIPLQKYMLAEYWLVRDANWSPDFPTAAQQALDLYTIAHPGPLNGVVAFDQTALVRLLKVIGPVQVADFPVPVRSDNLIDFMHQAWAPAPGQGPTSDWFAHRKDFMAVLGKEMLKQVQSVHDRGQLIRLAQAAYQFLQEKHVLVYLTDPQQESVLARAGLDGAVRPGAGDFLMVIDSNVGFNKMDARMEKAIQYQVDLSDPAAPKTGLTLSYFNPVSQDVACVPGVNRGIVVYSALERKCYWDYVRIYRPGDFQATSGWATPVPAEWLLTGEPEQGRIQALPDDLGAKVFSAMLVAPPQATRVVHLDGDLPGSAVTAQADGRLIYSLHLAIQPGSNGTRVMIRVTPPVGYTFQPQGRWIGDSQGHAVWDSTIRADSDLSLSLEPASP